MLASDLGSGSEVSRMDSNELFLGDARIAINDPAKHRTDTQESISAANPCYRLLGLKTAVESVQGELGGLSFY